MPDPNGKSKALLVDALNVLWKLRDQQEALRKLAKTLGELHLEEIRKTGVKRFSMGNTVLVLEYRPKARSPDRRWNLTEEAVEPVS